MSGRRGVLCHVCAYEYVHQRIGSARAKKRGRASQRQRPRQNNRNEEKVVKLVHARKDGRERVKVVRSIVWRVYTLRTDYGLVDPRVDPLHQTGLEKATLRTGTDGQMDKSIFNLRLAGWNIFAHGTASDGRKQGVGQQLKVRLANLIALTFGRCAGGCHARFSTWQDFRRVPT